MKTKEDFMLCYRIVSTCRDPVGDSFVWTAADEMVVARMNHDCRPNADYWFDKDTLVQHVFATRTIVPGEEISVTYIE